MNKLKLIFVFIIGLLAQNSYACSCVEDSGSLHDKVSKSFDRNSHIFSGLVVNVEDADTNQGSSSFGEVIYTFEIVKKYKGILKKKTIKVKSQKDSATCGYNFELGQTYLVYASGINNNISTGLCNRNSIIRNVQKQELKMLKKYKRKNKS